MIAPSDTPRIRRQQAAGFNFREGYQHALADVLTALEDGGEEAVREWISNNYETTP